MNCFYSNSVYNLEAMNSFVEHNPHLNEFINQLADLDKKMQEVDKLSIDVRSAINEIFWNIGNSVKKRRNTKETPIL